MEWTLETHRNGGCHRNRFVRSLSVQKGMNFTAATAPSDPVVAIANNERADSSTEKPLKLDPSSDQQEPVDVANADPESANRNKKRRAKKIVEPQDDFLADFENEQPKSKKVVASNENPASVNSAKTSSEKGGSRFSRGR